MRRGFGGARAELSKEVRVDEGLRIEALGRGEAIVDMFCGCRGPGSGEAAELQLDVAKTSSCVHATR